MNKWILAGIYSAPMAAFAVASSISSPKLDEAPMFTAPIQKVSLDISNLLKGDEEASPVKVADKLGVKTKVATPTKIAQVKVPSDISEELNNTFELSEVTATGPQASPPALEFAKQSTAYQDAAQSLAPEAYELGNFGFARSTADRMPALGGFSAGGAGAIETQLTTLQEQFDDADPDVKVSVTSVPLPAGLPLLAGGLALFGFMRRRQRS